MKKGDIVYFREEYILQRYSKVGDSYYYHFRYQIIENLVIQNLKYGTKHFAHSTILSRLITQLTTELFNKNKVKFQSFISSVNYEGCEIR